MNAAARLVHRHTLSRHLVLTSVLNRKQLFVLMLALAVVISALSIIYVTHTERIVYANYQRALNEYDRLQIERSQLLLEQSTQQMQANVEHTAETKLGMIAPQQTSFLVVRE